MGYVLLVISFILFLDYIVNKKNETVDNDKIVQ